VLGSVLVLEMVSVKVFDSEFQTETELDQELEQE
jgi:hypothetical protein